MTNSIGSNIRRLRKDSGLTQAELAQAVGVSVQAVSKWECGGTPDVALLPAIASRFNVSVDRLFGYVDEKNATLDLLIQQALWRTPEEERMNRAVELCWAAFKALTGIPNITELGFTGSYGVTEDDCTRCRVFFDEGIGYVSAEKDALSFFLFPDPKNGFESLLQPTASYAELFSALSDLNMLKAMHFLYSRMAIPFSVQHISNALSLDRETVETCLSKMIRFGWLEEEDVEIESGPLKLYRPQLSEAVISFFYFAGEILAKRRLWFLTNLKRNKPILNKKTADGPKSQK